MTALDVPQPRVTLEVRPDTEAIVLRGFGKLDDELAAAMVAEAAALPGSVPIVLDLSELTLARKPVLHTLLREVLWPGGHLVRHAVVVCRRLSARRLVRHAAGTVPVPVAATVEQALSGWGAGSPPAAANFTVGGSRKSVGRTQVDAVVVPFDGHQGGDYFDVVEVSPVATAISVVDAIGCGPPAAQLASRLRSREYRECLRLGEPEAVLAALDRSLPAHVEAFATAVCAVWSPASRRLRVANGGHVPPVVVTSNDVSFLTNGADPPVGLAGSRSVSDYTTPAGSTLVFCTNGLVERRRGSLDDGLATLRVVLGRRLPAETSAASVLEGMVDALGPLEDDVTVVVARAATATPVR